MYAKLLFVSMAVAAVWAVSAPVQAGLLGGSAGGGLGGSLSRGSFNGSMNGDLNSRFASKPDVAAPREPKAPGVTTDAKDAASATGAAKSTGQAGADAATGSATKATTAGRDTTQAATSTGAATSETNRAASAGPSGGSNANPPLPSTTTHDALGGSFDANAKAHPPASASLTGSSEAGGSLMTSQPQRSNADAAPQSHQ